MTTTSVKVRVSGHVQGVGFRFFTYREAKKLNLVGYVRNLDNGDVEIIAQGEQANIDALFKWLEQGGPPSAHIDHFASQPYTEKTYTQFDIWH